MNGAQALIRTLVDCGVDVCFTNPGTSEMHFVAALDAVPEMRGVLGAVRGRGHRRGRRLRPHGRPPGGHAAAPRARASATAWPTCTTPAGPARRSSTSSATTRRTTSSTTRRSSPTSRPSPATSRAGCARRPTPEDVAADAAEAVAAATAPPGQVATLILPADVSWLEAGEPAAAAARRRAARRSTGDAVAAVADGPALAASRPRCSSAARALREPGWSPPAGSPRPPGAKLLAETFPARLERGAGLPAVERLGYLAEFAADAARRARATSCSSTPRRRCRSSPTPARPSDLVPDGCEVHVLAAPARRRRRPRSRRSPTRVGAAGRRRRAPAGRRGPTARPAPLNAETVGRGPRRRCCPRARSSPTRARPPGLFALGRHRRRAPPRLAARSPAAPIGYRPARSPPAPRSPAPIARCVCLEADGSAMYTLQALWTQAREGLDVTTVILNNRSYAILNMELQPGRRRRRRRPAGRGHARPLASRRLDFVRAGQGLGVPGDAGRRPPRSSPTQLERALAEPGPHLIEAVLSRPASDHGSEGWGSSPSEGAKALDARP